MRYTIRDGRLVSLADAMPPRRWRWSNLLILLAVALAGSCVGCAAGALTPNPRVGSETWHVLSAHEVTDAGELAGFDRLSEDVEDCMGVEHEHRRPTLYTVAGIIYEQAPNKWGMAVGFTRIAQNTIYIVAPGTRLMGADHAITVPEVLATARHEIVHWRMKLPHPAADSLIAKCAPLDWRAR